MRQRTPTDEPRPLTVVLVSPTGTRPPGMPPMPLRIVADIAGVRASDDVVVIFGSGHEVRKLAERLGPHMPPVLVVAPNVAPDEVSTAFAYGATSYLVAGRAGPCVAQAVHGTARRVSFLAPSVAAMVVTRASRADVDRRASADTYGALSHREREIMELLVGGNSVAEASARLNLAEKTVRNNLSSIYAKLQVRRQSEAVLLWLGHRRDSAPSMSP